MKKVLAFVGIAVLMTSVAAAEINPSGTQAVSPGSAGSTRVNGTLGSLTITAQQVGPLQVQLDASVTTQGGDGVPVVVTFGGNTYTLNNQIGLYVQIYDSPWNGGCTTWATPGTDWCAVNWEYFLNSPTPLGSFAQSYTTTVPTAMNYQTFVLARGGLTWITPNFNWFNTSQYIYSSAVETIYIDSTQEPTPTPGGPTPTPPDPSNAVPVPSLNTYGIVAMVLLLVGVAILVMWRRS